MTPPRSTTTRHATAVGAPIGAPAVVGRAGSFVHGPAGGLPSSRGAAPARVQVAPGGPRGRYATIEAVLVAALACAVRAPWVFVRAPWFGFGRDLANGCSAEVFLESGRWHLRIGAPEIVSEPAPLASSAWWDAIAEADALIAEARA